MSLVPIPFTVDPAARRGVFQTGIIVNPGGYDQIEWELDIPNVSEYEDTGNRVTVRFLVNGDPSETVWTGGPFTNHLGTVDPPPVFLFVINEVAVGATLQVEIEVASAMTVGIQNGLIS